MKKILFALLIALCGVSFSFGNSVDDCLANCQSEAVSDCWGGCKKMSVHPKKYPACKEDCRNKYSSPDTVEHCNARCKK